MQQYDYQCERNCIVVRQDWAVFRVGVLFELHIHAGLTAFGLILFRPDLNFRLRYPIEANHGRYDTCQLLIPSDSFVCSSIY